MSILREVCHCGHAKDTHTIKACDGMYCDCEEYVNEFDPPPTKRQEFPAAAPFDEFADDPSGPITWPMFPFAPPVKP